MTEADRLAVRLAARRVGTHYVTLCPLHDDREPSLHFRQGEKGTVFTCRAGCDSAAVLAEMRRVHADVMSTQHGGGNGMGERVPGERPVRTTRYEVKDVDGWTVATHLRHDYADGRKSMPWETDGEKGLAGRAVTSLPLYGSELLKKCPEDQVVVCEGEKAADELRGIAPHRTVVVGTVTGASSVPDRDVLSSLVNRDVILWPDNDRPGYLHMERVAAGLLGIAKTVAFIDLHRHRSVGQGYDAADWVNDGRNWGDALVARVDSLREESASSVKSAPFISVEHLMALKLADQEWLWEGILPAGGALAVLGAYAKTGKSTMAYALVGAILRGESFLGRETKQVKIMMLALEERIEDVRAHAVGAGIETGLWFQNMDLPFRSGPETMASLEECVRREGIGLVVMDTIGRFWDIDNENDNAKVQQALDPLLDFTRRAGVTMLLVHHSNKYGESLKSIRGASSFVGVVDVIMVMFGGPGGPPMAEGRRGLSVMGRRVKEQTLMMMMPEPYVYGLAEDRQESDGEEAGSRREGKILAVLKDMGGAGSVYKLRKFNDPRLRIREEVLRYLFKKLQDEGRIVKGRLGLWVVAEEGKS